MSHRDLRQWVTSSDAELIQFLAEEEVYWGSHVHDLNRERLDRLLKDGRVTLSLADWGSDTRWANRFLPVEAPGAATAILETRDGAVLKIPINYATPPRTITTPLFVDAWRAPVSAGAPADEPCCETRSYVLDGGRSRKGVFFYREIR